MSAQNREKALLPHIARESCEAAGSQFGQQHRHLLDRELLQRLAGPRHRARAEHREAGDVQRSPVAQLVRDVIGRAEQDVGVVGGADVGRAGVVRTAGPDCLEDRAHLPELGSREEALREPLWNGKRTGHWLPSQSCAIPSRRSMRSTMPAYGVMSAGPLWETRLSTSASSASLKKLPAIG